MTGHRGRLQEALSLLLILLLLVAGCQPSPATAPDRSPAAGRLEMDVIDVGQGDCLLLISPSGKTMLVDGGDGEHAARTLAYLKGKGVKNLDLLVITHPHEDHIGGLPGVINSLPIDDVYMPDVLASTRAFENLVTALKKRAVRVHKAQAGMHLPWDDQVEVSVLAPAGTGYEDLNDYSVVVRLTYQRTNYLLTGDAGEVEEGEILARGGDISSQVLKVGHHGSNTSTSAAFLERVRPQVAVISVGAGNDYGHPGRYTLQRLAAVGARVYRTDLEGTIRVVSDGEKIKVYPEKKSMTSSAVPAAGGPYIGNTRSHVFHRSTCKSLPSPANRFTFADRRQALAAGYRPCPYCRP